VLRDGKPLLIEFVGCPGVGKSTAARELVKELERTGLTVHWAKSEFGSIKRKEEASFRGGKIWSRFRSLVRYPGIAIRSYALALFIPRARLSLLRKTEGLIRLAACIVDSGQNTAVDVVVADELFLHGLFSSFFGYSLKGSEERLQDLIRFVYTDHTHEVIHLVASASTCTGRFLQRSSQSSRFNKNSSVAIREQLSHDQSYDVILRVYQEATGREPTEINAEASPQVVRQAIIDVVQDLLSHDNTEPDGRSDLCKVGGAGRALSI
jgi:thymidylate kinase